MKIYPVPFNFSGSKFAARYGLSTTDGSFFVGGDGLLHVPDNLPDDPPIFDAPDPVLPSPPGLWVHEMKALSKRIGNNLVDGQGTTCFHIVVETEAHLSDPWLTGVHLDTGSTAYLMDKAKTVVWDGTKWK